MAEKSAPVVVGFYTIMNRLSKEERSEFVSGIVDYWNGTTEDLTSEYHTVREKPNLKAAFDEYEKRLDDFRREEKLWRGDLSSSTTRS